MIHILCLHFSIHHNSQTYLLPSVIKQLQPAFLPQLTLLQVHHVYFQLMGCPEASVLGLVGTREIACMRHCPCLQLVYNLLEQQILSEMQKVPF